VWSATTAAASSAATSPAQAHRGLLRERALLPIAPGRCLIASRCGPHDWMTRAAECPGSNCAFSHWLQTSTHYSLNRSSRRGHELTDCGTWDPERASTFSARHRGQRHLGSERPARAPTRRLKLKPGLWTSRAQLSRAETAQRNAGAGYGKTSLCWPLEFFARRQSFRNFSARTYAAACGWQNWKCARAEGFWNLAKEALSRRAGSYLTERRPHRGNKSEFLATIRPRDSARR